MKTTEYIKELNTKEIPELSQELTKQRRHLQDLRRELVLGKLKNYREIRQTRRKVAQLSTLMQTKAMTALVSAGTTAAGISKENNHGQE